MALISSKKKTSSSKKVEKKEIKVSSKQVKKAKELKEKLDLDDIQDTSSYLKEKSRKIRKLVKRGENDAAAELIMKSLTSVLIDLLPIAEARYRADPRQGNAYAFNNLVSTARELVTDLQANTDKSVVVNNIIFNILQPSSTTIVTFLIDTNFSFKKELAGYIKPEHAKDANDVIDKMSKSYVSFLKAVLVDIQDRISQALQET